MNWETELDRWLFYLESKGRSGNYINNARSALRHLGQRFGPNSYLDLVRDDFVAWFNELRKGGVTGKKGLSDDSMHFMAAVVKACLRWLNEGETPKSLRILGAIGLRTSRVESKEDLLTEGQFQRIVQPMPLLKRVIFRLMRATGAWPSEILRLQHRDARILVENGKTYAEVTFRNTKTKTNRTAYVGDPSVVQEVKEFLDGMESNRDSLLFPSPVRLGEPMLYGSILDYFKKRAKAVGIDKRVYSYMLRHMRATELMDANIPRQYANELIGWKGTMWDNYAHLGKDNVRDWVLEHETGVAQTPREELQRKLDEIRTLIYENPGLGVTMEGKVKAGKATELRPWKPED